MPPMAPVLLRSKELESFPGSGLYDCALAWDMMLTYDNGVVMNFIDNRKQRQGVLFQGTEGVSGTSRNVRCTF